MNIKSENKKIGLFFLVMISSAFVISVRNLPTIAETGLHMLFFAIVAAISFYIPAGLVSAELATGWSETGGIYVWVKAAFGRKWGLFATWLQWTYMMNSVIAMLYFIGGSLAYVLAPQLAQSRIFLIVVMLAIIWISTYLNLRGMRTSSWVSTFGFIGGVAIPGALIILLGIVYLIMGHRVQIDLTMSWENIIPRMDHITSLVLLIGFMRALAGIEASASHAGRVKKPSRNYPIAIFIVVIIAFLLNILGSLSVAIVIPQKQISLIAGIMEAFTTFFSIFNMGWIVPILGLLVSAGAIGEISTWFIGPVKGVMVSAQNGELPPFFKKQNKVGQPKNLLITQACVISLIGMSYLLMPNINIAFWLSVALSMMIYVTMYFFMFLSGLYLRYKAPNVKRAYKIPFGNIGMWIVACIGSISMIFAFIIAIFPPAQLPAGNHTTYITILISATVVNFCIPFIIHYFRKPSWVEKKKTTTIQRGRK